MVTSIELTTFVLTDVYEFVYRHNLVCVLGAVNKLDLSLLITVNYMVLLSMLMQREYFKQGKIEQFRQILEEGSSPGIFHLQIGIPCTV